MIISRLINRFKKFYNLIGGGDIIKNIGVLKRVQNIEIYGYGNNIEIKCNFSKSVKIMIRGNNNRLTIEENVEYSKGLIWFEDNYGEIFIDKNTTIGDANLSVAENGRKIIIGADCMFSKGINISTTDSHSIINLKTGERTNQAQDVVIGEHVWLGRNVTINKGVKVGSNSIVAGNSVLTKSIPSNCIAAGVPASVVKSSVDWLRQRI